MERLDSIDRIKALREGGYVERLHCQPHLGTYNNATHSYNVAQLLLVLWPIRHGMKLPSSELLAAALSHDVAERWTGDIPYSAKVMNHKLRKHLRATEVLIEGTLRINYGVSDEEEFWLKCCDMLELYIWCREQQYMGNRNVKQMTITAHDKLMSNPNTPQEIINVLSEYSPGRLDDFFYNAEDQLNER